MVTKKNKPFLALFGPPELLGGLAKERNPEVRENVAQNPHATEEHLEHLTKDRDLLVVMHSARHPNLSKEQVDRLSIHRVADVRHNIVYNKNATKAHLERLANDHELEDLTRAHAEHRLSSGTYKESTE